MDGIELIMTEQLQQFQMSMHRAAFQDYQGDRQPRSPHRGRDRVLAVLKLRPEINQRDLSCLLGMSKRPLVELLTRLEKNGYITREPSQRDKQVLIVRLMEEGTKAVENVEQKPSDTESVLDCLNEEEFITFSGSFQRTVERYEEQFPEADYEQHRRVMGAFMIQHKHHRDFRAGSPDGRENLSTKQRPNNRPGRRNKRGEL